MKKLISDGRFTAYPAASSFIPVLFDNDEFYFDVAFRDRVPGLPIYAAVCPISSEG